ncbi:hypothetical protein [Verminephrobacter aporrectodeae]|uniref:hypothetical protein n=1 Tax=Verminephrobacter aporrectodeae TaxID=1110389 RepID=UPI002238D836|nr:hypothetical protein [Verminephrobacter aporrectodeae]
MTKFTDLAPRSGSKLRYQRFTTSGTFSPSAALLEAGGQVFFEAAGGGGGGGSAGIANGYAIISGAGGGSSKKRGFLTVTGPITIVIGTKGIGGTASTFIVGLNGSGGGSTTIGTVTVAGGKGGRGATYFPSNGGAHGGIAGDQGEPGESARYFGFGNFIYSVAGRGGGEGGGAPGGSTPLSLAGENANSNTGGGGGGGSGNANSGYAGGDGADGFVDIWWFE